jgi:cation diffusion facilitator family transporter
VPGIRPGRAEIEGRGEGVGYRREEEDTKLAGRTRRIRQVLWIILLLNLAVSVAKLVWGIISHSSAMQADGFHSMFDGASNVVGLVGMWMASRPADRDHPYGHGKYETYASGAIAAMLVFAAYRIGSEAVQQLTHHGVAPTVDAVSFAVMIGTLAVNIGVTMWERRIGKALGSEILVADASHTSSDVLVSLGVIVSLGLVKAGYTQADAIVALLVSVAIAITAWQVFRQASATLSDSARIPSDEVCKAVLEYPGVLGCHHVRTRGSAAEVYVDLHIQVDETRTVADGHRIAEEVERLVVDRFPEVVDVIAHLEPFDAYQAEKTAKEMDGGLA